VDITKYVLTKFTPDALRQYVFEGHGGDSKVTLESFLQPESWLAGYPPEMVPDLLGKYGPALVSNFRVHADFMNPGQLRHEVRQNSEKMQPRRWWKHSAHLFPLPWGFVSV
jgi:hypothetical protein